MPHLLPSDDSNTVTLFSKRIYVTDSCGYFHVGVLINRFHDINGSASKIFIEFDPEENSSFLGRVFSFLFPIQGVVNINSSKNPYEEGFERIAMFPLSWSFITFLDSNINEEEVVKRFRSYQSKYKVDSNNCRVFAQAVIQDATCFTDYDISKEHPLAFF
jgi:hypothetical protein